MSFTTQPPTIPGAYRWRISADMPDVHLAEVSDADGMLVAQRGSNPARYCVELCGGEWEGPLVIAEEALATASKEMAEAARTPNASACGSPLRAFSRSANCCPPSP